MYWIIYTIVAVFVLMEITMIVITFVDAAESRRTKKMYETLTIHAQEIITANEEFIKALEKVSSVVTTAKGERTDET